MSTQLATDIREYMKNYFDAWTGGDIENILSYYSDDVVIHLLGPSALLEGKAAVTANFVVPFCTAFPGNFHKVQNFIHHDNQVIVEWLFQANHQGEFAGIPATGKAVNLPGCSVYTVEGDKITAGKLYFNLPTLLQQIGVG